MRMRIYPGLDLVGGPVVAAVCATATLLETALPLRPRSAPRRSRWAENALAGLLAAVFVRGAVVPAAQAAARAAARRRLGLLRWLPMPGLVRVGLGILALDYTMYLWHRALHGVAPLWRFHAVHHADPDLDASTALRFHAGEILASVPYRCVQVVVLGVSPSVALAYEVAMQSAALFHHSNLRLPERVDRALSYVIVTPRMHGVHHSLDTRELESNWSVVFSFWDRLHGTFRERASQPRVGLAPENTPGARTLRQTAASFPATFARTINLP